MKQGIDDEAYYFIVFSLLHASVHRIQASMDLHAVWTYFVTRFDAELRRLA